MKSQAETRRTRRDAFPEEAKYSDTGCFVHPSCLTCPLDICIFEHGRGTELRRAERLQRAREALALSQAGWSVDRLMKHLACSRRQVFRLLEMARQAPTAVPLRQLH